MWQELQVFGFRALWSPYFMIFILALAVAYYILFIHRIDEKRASNKQIIFFYSGLVVLYIVKGSPLDLMSHIVFTAHMIQMALFFLLIPIFLIKGIPVWTWKIIFNIPVLKHILRFFTKPLIAVVLFNGMFSFYHVPAIFDFAKSNDITHALIHSVILIAAFFMWWPIFTPIKEMDTLTPLLKIGYIFANGVLITPACALIIFSENGLYATYGASGSWMQALALCVPAEVLSSLSLSGPEMFTNMELTEDQRLGGIVMKITQEVIYSFVLARVFFPWFMKGSDKIDPLPVNQHSEQL